MFRFSSVALAIFLMFFSLIFNNQELLSYQENNACIHKILYGQPRVSVVINIFFSIHIQVVHACIGLCVLCCICVWNFNWNRVLFEHFSSTSRLRTRTILKFVLIQTTYRHIHIDFIFLFIRKHFVMLFCVLIIQHTRGGASGERWG